MNNASCDLVGPLIVVAAALRDGDGRVLVQRRPPGTAHAGLWEFPGGKVEPGEPVDRALVRELREELAVDVEPATLVPICFAPGDAGGRELLLLFYLVETWRGEPRPLVADVLAWFAPAQLADLAMPPADRPLVTALSRLG